MNEARKITPIKARSGIIEGGGMRMSRRQINGCNKEEIDMAKSEKVKLKVLWGEAEHPEKIMEYEFKTKGEKEAFLWGAREMEGWNDFYADEEIDEYVAEYEVGDEERKIRKMRAGQLNGAEPYYR